MNDSEILRRRLRRQLARGAFAEPSDVVGSLCALQAQDYLGALWAIGLRLSNAHERDIEQALAGRRIVRTWPMRGTLHFAAAADVRWMLELLAPHVVARAAGRFAQLALGDADFARSRRALSRFLRGGPRTRKAVYRALEAAGISTVGQRGIHILWRLAQEGLLCFGPRQRKEHTFVLLDEWVPDARRLGHDEALAEVSRRYFEGHGPATLSDFIWWSGLPAGKARSGLEMVKSALGRDSAAGRAYWFADQGPANLARARTALLLPAFDEYLVGYRDRAAVVVDSRAVNAGGGMLAPTMILKGRVVGTWKRSLRGDRVIVTMSPFAPLKKAELQAMARAAAEYAAFVGGAASAVFVPKA